MPIIPQRVIAIRALVCATSLALACLSSGGALAEGSPSENPGAAAGLGLGSVLATALYAPVKIIYATGGAVVGGLAWIFTGGNTDAAMAIFRPSMAGDYVVTPEHLRNPRSIEFIGKAQEPAQAKLPDVSAPPPSDLCVLRSSVTFATDVATLDSAARSELDEVARESQRCPDQRVQIQGYADDSGGPAQNQELSEKRARAVEGYLAEQGVERSQIAATGLGSTNPISSNATAEGRAANRRAEIALISR